MYANTKTYRYSCMHAGVHQQQCVMGTRACTDQLRHQVARSASLRNKPYSTPPSPRLPPYSPPLPTPHPPLSPPTAPRAPSPNSLNKKCYCFIRLLCRKSTRQVMKHFPTADTFPALFKVSEHSSVCWYPYACPGALHVRCNAHSSTDVHIQQDCRHPVPVTMWIS